MSKFLNATIIEEYTRVFEGLESALVISYQGVDAMRNHSLRGALRERGLSMRVMRNRLARVALAKAGKEPLGALLDGPVALVFGEDEEGAIIAAKTIAGMKREFPEIQLMGGLVSGEAVSGETLKGMKSRAETLATLAGQIAGPGARLAGAIGSPAAKLASQIEKIGKDETSES